MIASRDLSITNELQRGSRQELELHLSSCFPFSYSYIGMPTEGSSHRKSLLSHPPLLPHLVWEEAV